MLGPVTFAATFVVLAVVLLLVASNDDVVVFIKAWETKWVTS